MLGGAVWGLAVCTGLAPRTVPRVGADPTVPQVGVQPLSMMKSSPHFLKERRRAENAWMGGTLLSVLPVARPALPQVGVTWPMRWRVFS